MDAVKRYGGAAIQRQSAAVQSLLATVGDGIAGQEDLDGQIVHQGIAVYGNKGSTDQHAYVQQLREVYQISS